MKKLIVVENVIEEEEVFTYKFNPGYRWTYFQDPETGKVYEPKSTFVVEGDNLEDLFVEVDFSNTEEVE